MAGLMQQDRLQPSLLDRLTDNNAQRKPYVYASAEKAARVGNVDTEVVRSKPEADDKLIVNSRTLKEFIKRDLAWLLNTGNLADVTDLSAYPLTAASVLNYGMPDLTGVLVANTDVHALQKQMRKIILNFEPRIIAKTLKVRVSKSEQMTQNALTFEIECDIWGQPAPEYFYVNSELNLESGLFEFKDVRVGQ